MLQLYEFGYLPRFEDKYKVQWPAYLLLLIHHNIARSHSVVRVHNEFIIFDEYPNFSKDLTQPIAVRLRITKRV